MSVIPQCTHLGTHILMQVSLGLYVFLYLSFLGLLPTKCGRSRSQLCKFFILPDVSHIPHLASTLH